MDEAKAFLEMLEAIYKVNGSAKEFNRRKNLGLRKYPTAYFKRFETAPF